MKYHNDFPVKGSSDAEKMSGCHTLWHRINYLFTGKEIKSLMSEWARVRNEYKSLQLLYNYGTKPTLFGIDLIEEVGSPEVQSFYRAPNLFIAPSRHGSSMPDNHIVRSVISVLEAEFEDVPLHLGSKDSITRKVAQARLEAGK